MTEKILFIDYENVRDKALLNLPEHDRVLLFIGKESLEAKTQKPEAAFIKSIMGRHARLDMIPVPERGDNNLDLHLAFYLGKTLAEEPHAHYIIYTKDSKDFGPLVAHLAKRGISCERLQPPVAERATRTSSRATPAPAPRPAPAPATRVAAPRAPVKAIAARTASEKPAVAKAALAPKTPAPAAKAPVAAKRDDLYAEALAFLKRAGKRKPTTGKKLINSLESHLKVKPPRGEQIVKELSLDGVLSISNGAVSYKI